MMSAPRPRSLGERREAAHRLLGAEHQLWLATGRNDHGPHLIPVGYVWDDGWLTMATFLRSRTAANLRAQPQARAAIGQTQDLAMIDGEVGFIEVTDIDDDTADRLARISHDPRTRPGLVYLSLAPVRIQVWNGFHEFGGRTVMKDGRWLTDPVD